VTVPAIWALTASAPSFDAPAREQIEISLAGRDIRASRWATLTTCHRVEAYGAGEPPADRELPRDAAGRTPDLLRGSVAVRHLCELATGLRSAVVGEQQILHQLRAALREGEAAGLDPTVARVWHVALWAGRRARSGRQADAAGQLGLGNLAAIWIERELGGMAGRRVLVAGNGAMGRALLRAVEMRGAVATVATRRPQAGRNARPALDLAEAAERLPEMDAVAVALSGPWLELAGRASLPVAIDLSFPSAVSADLRRLAARFADVDTLAAPGPMAGGPPEVAYQARAERIVDEAAGRVDAWFAARPSAAAIGRIRSRADADRERALARLFRRLPDLDEREQRLVRAMAEQLVATVLHRPTAALGRDEDGSASAAAERLFDR
jgi:glutamyl-tRNA reductase